MEPIEKSSGSARKIVVARPTLCAKTKVKLGWLEDQIESRLLHSVGGTLTIRIKHCASGIRDIQISEEANTIRCK